MVRSAAIAYSGNSPGLRVNAREITATVVVVVATLGLSFTAGLNPVLPAVVAGAFLFAVLLIGNRSWIVHALLIVTFTQRRWLYRLESASAATSSFSTNFSSSVAALCNRAACELRLSRRSDSEIPPPSGQYCCSVLRSQAD